MASAPPTPPRVSHYGLAWLIVLASFAWATSARAQDAQSPSSNDLFARSAWHFELGTHGAVEAWNFNVSREHLAAGTIGLSYGLRRSLVLVLGLPVYFIEQRGPNAWLLGTTWGVRWRALERRRVAIFLELQVGVSRASERTPPDGTRFNYLALGTVGITTSVARGTHLLTGLKWVHVSNHGRAGPGRNPDIEAVGPQVSILRRF